MQEILTKKIPSTRYKQLDSLRGLAAVAVFLYHYLNIYKITAHWDTWQKTPFGILTNGPASVIFFFALSGFVISLPFINNDRPLNLTAFYTKRVLRIYPAYIVIISLSLFFKFYLFDKTSMFPFSTWYQGFWTWNWTHNNIKDIIKTYLLIGPKFNSDLIDPAVWSLVVEMQMSLILPFFIIIVAKANTKFNLIFAIVLLYCSFTGKAEGISIFFLGILLAKYHKLLTNWFAKKPRWLIFIIGFFAILLYNSNYEYFRGPREANHHFKYFLRDYIIAIGSCIIIIIMISSKRLTLILEKKLFLFLGEISYSFYLIHMPMTITVASLISYKSSLSYFYIFAGSLSASIAFSAIIYHFIEIPFQKLGGRLVKKYKMLETINVQS